MGVLKKLLAGVLVVGTFSQGAFAADVTLRFAWWGGGARHEATLKAIKVFEAKNPGVTIKGEYGGFNGYAEKMTVQLAGGTEADIMQLDWAWLSQFSKTGDGFYDLKKSNQINLDDFAGEIWKSGLVNGKLNGVPVGYTARVFMWNKSTWDKAGLPLPKTWDDLFAAGKVFEQKLGKDYYPMDGMLNDIQLLGQAYMLQKTGKPWLYPNMAKVAYTEAEALEWVQFYKRLIAEHVVIPHALRVSAAGGDPEAGTERLPDWASGKIAGLYQWDSTVSNRLTTLPKTTTLDIGDFLAMKGAKSSGYIGRPNMMMAVSKNSKNPEIAAKFVNWLVNSTEAADILGSTRGTSVSKPFRDVQVKANKFIPLELKAIKQIEAAKIDSPSPYGEYNRMLSWVREVFEKVAMGKITDQEAAKMLVDDTNTLLRRMK